MSKVDVVTVSDVKISKFRWWSNWIDICVFDYAYCGQLLQMKVSRTNAKKFRVVAMKSLLKFAEANSSCASDLVQMKRP